MHSHDRTMLAQMGFSDPDKKEPLHELACQFLTQRDVAEKIGAMIRPHEIRFSVEQKGQSRPHYCPNYAEGCKRWGGDYRDSPIGIIRNLEYTYDSIKLQHALTEVPINKGEGKYRTTVGFIDVSMEFLWLYTCSSTGPTVGKCYCGWVAPADEWPGAPVDKTVNRNGPEVRVEVKVARVPVSDVIRQIGLYRQYALAHRWCLATPWGVTPHEKKCLDDQRIVHIRLGEGFDQFCARAATLPAADSGLVL